MSDDGLTEEDLVTWDDLPEETAQALRDGELGFGDGEPDTPEFGPEDAAEVTERKMTEFMHHLTHESCDTPECQQFRDAFGIGDEDHEHAEEGDSGAGSSEGGAEAEAGNEPDTNDGQDGTETQEGEEAGESGEEQSEPDSTDDDPDVETNYLGEEI